jgi:hypothetical protein
MPERVSGAGKQLCSCQCHPDLGWIRFGDSRISVTDVDCLFVVERKGKFLWMEWKEITEALPMGQRLMIEALSRVPGFTVLVLRGRGGYPETLEHVRHGDWGFIQRTSAEDFQRRVDAWYEAANGS